MLIKSITDISPQRLAGFHVLNPGIEQRIRSARARDMETAKAFDAAELDGVGDLIRLRWSLNRSVR